MKDYKNLIKANWQKLILLILVLIGIFFAFYKFPYRYNLDDEIIRDVVVATEGSRQLQAPLIGAFSSTGPYTFGPWYYYQLIGFSIIANTFYSSWIYLGIAYLASILLLYLIGKELGDKVFGVILASLGVFSPVLIIGATHLTNPNLVTVFALLSIYLFLVSIKNSSSHLLSFLFGVSLGIAINIHYQALSLLILVLLAIYKKRDFNFFAYSILGLFITFIPMLLFDLNNHWFNLRNFTYYLLHGKDLIYVPNRWLFYIRDFWPAYWGDVIGVDKTIALLFMVLSGVVALYQITRRKLSVPFRLIYLAFFIDFIAMRYYWGERFFGYFNFLRPFVFILTGYLFYFVYKNVRHGKFIALGLFLFLLVIILPKSLNRLTVDPFTLDIYKQVSLLESTYPDEKFTLFICNNSYKGNDQRLPKSILFLLESRGKIVTNGFRIGIEKTRCSKKDQKTRNLPLNKLMLTKGHFEELPKSSLADFSEVDTKSLSKAGWEPINFSMIWESTVRWWFKEQP